MRRGGALRLILAKWPITAMWHKKKKEARKKLTGQTLKAAIERFLESNKRTGRYWVHKEARLLGKDMAPLHSRPLASIKRGDLLAVIDKVKMRGKTKRRPASSL